MFFIKCPILLLWGVLSRFLTPNLFLRYHYKHYEYAKTHLSRAMCGSLVPPSEIPDGISWRHVLSFGILESRGSSLELTFYLTYRPLGKISYEVLRMPGLDYMGEYVWVVTFILAWWVDFGDVRYLAGRKCHTFIVKNPGV